MKPGVRPLVLIVLDGWGLSDQMEGNAVALAHTPTYDRLVEAFPFGTLSASGRDVGLPPGQMGNSEVGHLNLGAGFVVDQDLTRLDEAIDSGAFYAVGAFVDAFRHAAAHGGRVHLIGLIGEGGVHAHTRHLVALLEMARRMGVRDVVLHAFTDGRDAPPASAPGFMDAIERRMGQLGVGRVATVSGRYWGMDRDNRWERTQRAWDAMVKGTGRTAASASEALAAAYSREQTDEFIEPTVIQSGGLPVATIQPGDTVILFNFRADRMRQLLWAFTEPDRAHLDGPAPDVFLATMTDYGKDGQKARIAFASTPVEWPLARVISDAGLPQLHTAETEKYAHVTYFFNGGAEAPFPGEDRVMVPSLKVATYDLAPEMSARPLTDLLVERLLARRDAFVLVNYANPDMVGHTGVLPAAIQAVEVVDECLGRVMAAVEAIAGAALITADHGNCEVMVDPITLGPHTAHTTNRTPCIVSGPGLSKADGVRRLNDGRLCDVAPTVLGLMDLPAPGTMTGRNLVPGLPDRPSPAPP